MVLGAMSTNLYFRTFTGCRLLKRFTIVHQHTHEWADLQYAASLNVLRSQRRLYSPHHPPFPYPEIPSQQAAKSFVVHLDERGRSLLLQELSQCKEESDKSALTDGQTPQVSRAQLKDVLLYHGIPFIGFGILDNMIMIIAGEYIDVTLGAMLGISTMAAAALGNLISDLAGVGTAGYVELLASKVGVRPPDITPAQAHSSHVRWAVGLGRSLGITLGCIIGMFPLLFFKSADDKNTEDTSTQTPPEDSTVSSTS